MKEKYGDQDEEERQLRMEILAVRSCLLTLTTTCIYNTCFSNKLASLVLHTVQTH